jgi:hypothetical protein
MVAQCPGEELIQIRVNLHKTEMIIKGAREAVQTGK